ncbi:hypothetical protein C0991_008772 [Blastosporella zonata]|nr:hypothetical protein C0991_008772 [Blastosporella zonata]
MSDDEFDRLPDDFSGMEGINWDELLSAPPPTADPSQDPPGRHEASAISARSPGADSSTHYSCDEEDLDPRFFAELDNLEKDIMLSQTGQKSTITVNDASELRDSTILGELHTSYIEILDTKQVDVHQRIGTLAVRVLLHGQSPSSRLPQAPPSELHSNTLVINSTSSSENARQPQSSMPSSYGLAHDMPMIPNFAMDNAVEKHVAALGQSGISEWIPGGTKHIEWLSRKERWKKGTVERAKAKKTQKPLNQAFILWEILSEDELDDRGDEEGYGTLRFAA